ncbi:hypothetical protein JXA47_09585 [Candidatus Sumerlaeota bacterium]|nr:hypothetical protein [Candidatus Sumerlaeota bacterium]
MRPDLTRTAVRPRFLTELALIGISLMLGLLLWFIASNQEDAIISREIAIIPTGVPANVEIDVLQSTANLRLSVPANFSELVGDSDLELRVDISGVASRAGIETAATIDYPISVDDVDIVTDLGFSPQLIERLSVSPRQITVRARLITETFTVRPILVGLPAQHHHLEGETRVEPERVWLTGSPASLEAFANKQRFLPTEPNDLTGLTAGEHTFSPDIPLPDSLRLAGVRQTTGGPIDPAQGRSLTGEVRVTVAEDVVERQIAGVEARLTFQRPNLELVGWEPRRFTVTIEGPLSLTAQVASTDFVVGAPLLHQVVDRAMSVSLQAEARWREGISDSLRSALSIRSVDPPQVQVEVVATTPPTPTPEPTPPLTNGLLPLTPIATTPEL